MLTKKLLFGYYDTQCLSVISKLNIADHLSAGPQSVDTLSELTGADKNKLYRILRYLTSKDIFEELPNKTFQLNQAAEPLLSNNKNSLKHFIEMHTDYFYLSANQMSVTIKSEKSSFEACFGKSAGQYFQDNEKSGKIYHQAMKENSLLYAEMILNKYDFSPYHTLVDVGGGIGSLLVSILLQYPELRGINFDVPGLEENATRYYDDNNLSSRCQYVSGDFFKTIPSGGDLYMMKAILHGKTDEQAIDILRRCHSVTPSDGKLLVIERIIDTSSEFYSDACLNDINVLNFSQGYVRTRKEFENLFKQSGFLLQNIFSLDDSVCIIELAIS